MHVFLRVCDVRGRNRQNRYDEPIHTSPLEDPFSILPKLQQIYQRLHG